MYTRNQGNTRSSPAVKGSAAFSTDGKPGIAADNTAGMPILIPKDYHGELLRGHHMPMTENDSTDSELPSEEVLDASAPNGAVDIALSVTDDAPHDAAAAEEARGHGNSLVGGLYDLLLGENSSEEETLLLLGIGLLLLWGHLDRGGLFDRSTWDADDLALLLIGYLLLS